MGDHTISVTRLAYPLSHQYGFSRTCTRLASRAPLMMGNLLIRISSVFSVRFACPVRRYHARSASTLRMMEPTYRARAIDLFLSLRSLGILFRDCSYTSKRSPVSCRPQFEENAIANFPADERCFVTFFCSVFFF